MARERQGDTVEGYLAEFDGSGVPPDVALAVRAYLQRWMATPEAFPVRASDSVYLIYGIVNEDLEDAADEILRATGRAFPEGGSYPERVKTVGELARFVAWCPHRL